MQSAEDLTLVLKRSILVKDIVNLRDVYQPRQFNRDES